VFDDLTRENDIDRDSEKWSVEFGNNYLCLRNGGAMFLPNVCRWTNHCKDVLAPRSRLAQDCYPIWTVRNEWMRLTLVCAQSDLFRDKVQQLRGWVWEIARAHKVTGCLAFLVDAKLIYVVR
jgi:hypothetical protein